MSGDTDFIQLYQELGLGANCTLDELKRAYRKRVGVLHPDRQTAYGQSGDGLQQLNSMYRAAIEFQRRHGRLPGATHGVPLHSPRNEARRAHPHPPAPVGAQRRGILRPLLAILLVAVAGIWAASEFQPEESAAPIALEHPSPATASGSARVTRDTLLIALGASAQQVRSIHGVPVNGSELRWEYGPSWIAFRCGEVSDWYSSPLRPLKVATPRPLASATWAPPRNCKE